MRMNGTGRVYVLVFMAWCVLFPAFSVREGRGQMPKPPHTFVEGELLVGFFEGVRETRRDEIHQEMGSTVLKRFDTIHVDHVKLRTGLPVNKAIEQYTAHTNEVRYAEPNYEVRVPNVPKTE